MPENSATKPAPAQDTRFRHFLSACRKWGGFALIAGLVLFVLVWLALEYRDILIAAKAKLGASMAQTSAEATAQFIREIFLVCAGVIGVLLTLWRIKLAERRLLNEQFANAAELMAKETTGKEPKPAIAARTGGIYIMADLAKQKPKEFAERVVKNLIAYIKDNAQRTATLPPKNSEILAKVRILGGDVKTAFSVLSNILGNEALKKHVADEFLDFSQQDFSELNFIGIDMHPYKKWAGTNFSGCCLISAHFAEKADIYGADLSDAILCGATLSRVILTSANLRGAILESADMQRANLVCAKMQGCYMPFAKLEKSYMIDAQLAGANLENAYLSGANMDHADLRGAMLFRADLTDAENLLSAEFGETHMVETSMDGNDGAELLKRAKSTGRKIWLYGACEGEMGNRSDGTNWRLEEYDGYALAGILMNFAEVPFNENLWRSVKSLWLGANLRGEPENIRRQAAMLEKVPEDTPDEIKAWLKKIRAEYSGQ